MDMLGLIERKQGGVFYTSSPVVDLMIRLAWRFLPAGNLKPIKVFDPAVGRGVFLLGVREAVKREPERQIGPTRQIGPAELFGMDRDPDAVAACQALGLNHVVCGDSLLELPPLWGEFDLVLANPPYVRQELLDKEYKKLLARKMGKTGIQLKKRSDLYAYFLARLDKLLKPGGVAVVIASTSWLDVDFGAPIRKFLLERFRLHLVLDSACERWFAEAGVNTGIIVLEKPTETETARGAAKSKARGAEKTADYLVRFAQLKKPLADFAEDIVNLPEKLFKPAETLDLPDIRVNPINKETLQEEHRKGGHPFTWGQYLRAPSVYFRILDRGQGCLCTLGELAQVHFGVKTGCNGFFYLPEARWGDVEPEHLCPVVKSPREVAGLVVDPAKLGSRLLKVDRPPAPGEESLVQAYLALGERLGYHLRSSIRNRDLWYHVDAHRKRGLLFRRFFHDRFNIPLVPEGVAADQTFYRVVGPLDEEVLGALLNSTVAALLIELNGRLGLGEGVLQFAVYEAAQVLVPDLRKLEQSILTQLKNRFRELSGRPAETIFTEVNQKDRQALDLVVLKALGFSPSEAVELLPEMYSAFTALVARRLGKAKTLLQDDA